MSVKEPLRVAKRNGKCGWRTKAKPFDAKLKDKTKDQAFFSVFVVFGSKYKIIFAGLFMFLEGFQCVSLTIIIIHQNTFYAIFWLWLFFLTFPNHWLVQSLLQQFLKKKFSSNIRNLKQKLWKKKQKFPFDSHLLLNDSKNAKTNKYQWLR